MDECIDACIDAYMGACMNGCMHPCFNAWMDASMLQCMDGCLVYAHPTLTVVPTSNRYVFSDNPFLQPPFGVPLLTDVGL